MTDTAVPMDATTRAALQKLADIWIPAPVPWTPQTSGWAVLGGIILVAIVWAGVGGIRTYHAARYRREALTELDAIEMRLLIDRDAGAALASIPELLKRVTLGAWPRVEVAALSGTQWVAFLTAHAGRSGLSDVLVEHLAGEYAAHRSVMDIDHARSICSAARKWIRGHDVSN